eukprot:CAMPEP_0119333374 /NCGR_PEP_ID=MMETSP1333-20130426/85027_1 /TAXON_ID=418940 /ORGANISM="Scyphosphaera apsteinii, Strain RCC1455" /LENGTH=368 /DNA_ID=CAMNT_0007343425 /DNA_START=147 /DNA_END=1250 /DNA_ORIENTATION=-
MSITVYFSTSLGDRKLMKQTIPESWLLKRQPVRKLTDNVAKLILGYMPDFERVVLSTLDGKPLESSAAICESIMDGATYTIEEKELNTAPLPTKASTALNQGAAADAGRTQPAISFSKKGVMAACECCVLKASVSWREAVGDITEADGDGDLLSAASFLAAIKFPHVRRTRSSRTISVCVRRVASRACAAVVELVDVERRFCARQLPRALLLACDMEGNVVGTSGLEPAVWSRTKHIVLPSYESEARVQISDGTRTTPQDFELSAMITCVAVEPSLRRSGLAQEMCTRLDALAAEWGLGASLLMQVPQANSAARWLGAKMGYREGFRGPRHFKEENESAENVEVDDLDNEGVKDVVVTLGKQIGPVTW